MEVTSLNIKVKAKLGTFRARNVIPIRNKGISIQNLLFMILLLEFLVILLSFIMVHLRPVSYVKYVLNKDTMLPLVCIETLTHMSLLRIVKSVIEVTILQKLAFIGIRIDLNLHK